MRIFRFQAIACGLLLCGSYVLSQHSYAEDDDIYRMTGEESVPEIVDALTPVKPAKTTRSLGDRSIRRKPPKPPKLSADIIKFEFDSHALTPEARKVLDIVGPALKHPAIKDDPILIEGHTDIVGDEAYNQRLSELRAKAVKNYLVSNFDIRPSRLEVIGLGKEGLINKQDPRSEENRRVQFVNIRDKGR